jgi:DNA-binding NarL/FixJ family response regulator
MSQPLGRIRVALADDHPIVLAGLRNLLQVEPDFELVGEAVTGIAGLRLVRETVPDVMVADVSLPELNGIMLTRRIGGECPSVRVLLLTLHEDRAYVNQALQAGARGYVLKRSAAENLVPAIRAVYLGGLYIDPALAGRMRGPGQAARRGAAPETASAELTEREAQVLRLIALGLTNKEIARRLDIGVMSVEKYKARGAERLGLRTRADIVRYASAAGWLMAL